MEILSTQLLRSNFQKYSNIFTILDTDIPIPNFCIQIESWNSIMTKSSVNAVLVWTWNRNVRVPIPPCIFWYLQYAPKPSSGMCMHRDVVLNTNSVNLLNSLLCALPHVKARGAVRTSLLWLCQSEKCEGRGPWWVPASASLHLPISSLCFCSKALKTHLGIKKGNQFGDDAPRSTP